MDAFKLDGEKSENRDKITKRICECSDGYTKPKTKGVRMKLQIPLLVKSG